MAYRSGTVAVVGVPNVGKSTLINALVRQKVAIVSPKPQTTRRNLLGILSQPEFQIAFVDTPGMIAPKNRLGVHMLRSAKESLELADAVLFVVDGSHLPGAGDREVAALITRVATGPGDATGLLTESQVKEVGDAAGLLTESQVFTHNTTSDDATRSGDRSHHARLDVSGFTLSNPELPPISKTPTPVVLAMNKMDRLPADKVKAHTEAYWALLPEGTPWMMTCATRRDNLDKLLELLVPLLPHGEPLYPEEQVTDATERFLTAEFIREQALLLAHEEVPHAVAVLIDRWEERENGMIYIAATIYVEREGQKGILVGKGGSMLKDIGARSRVQIEEMLGRKVFMELWVKVKPSWRDRPGTLHELELDR